MGTTAYGGKGFKGRAAHGDRPIGAASCRQEQHPMATCQPPPPPPPLPELDGSQTASTTSKQQRVPLLRKVLSGWGSSATAQTSTNRRHTIEQQEIHKSRIKQPAKQATREKTGHA